LYSDIANTINISGGALNLYTTVTGTIYLNNGTVSLGTGVSLPTNLIDVTGNGGVLGVSGTGNFLSSMTALPGVKWYLGTTSNATFNGSVLAAAADNTYKLGGGGGVLTIQNSVLTGSNNVLIGTGAGGTVVLQGNANDYTGSTTVQSGTLSVASIGNSSSLSSSLGAGTSQVILDSTNSNVALNYTGAGESTDRNILAKGGNSVVFGNSGLGQLNLTNVTVDPSFAGSIVLGNHGDSSGGTFTVDASLLLAGGKIAKDGLTNSTWILNTSLTFLPLNNITINGGVLDTGNVAFNQVTLAGADNTHYAILQTNGSIGSNITLGSNSGFAAKGGTLTVTLASNLQWWAGATTLAFGSTTADNKVYFTNDIDIYVGDTYNGRYINVEKGTGNDAAVISGNIYNSLSGGSATNVTLQKVGQGTLILTGSNDLGSNTAGTTYGTIAVQAGTLLVNNSVSGNGSATGYGNVTVAANGVFGGNGKVILKGTSGITMAANSVFSLNPAILGNTPGTGHLVLDMTNSTGVTTFSAGSSFLFNLNGSGLGSADLLEFSGLSAANQVVFNGNTLNFTINNVFSAGSYTLNLMQFDGVGAANYSSLVNSLQLGGGLTGFSNVQLAWDSVNNILQLDFTVDAIPEPSVYALLLFGGLLLTYVSYRKRKAAEVKGQTIKG
jgi:autotransporter-associated beta strand protein